MAAYTISHLRSINELRDAARKWDDLWRRSNVTIPTVRAELIAQWVEQFALDKTFHAVVVQKENRLVAALPLVASKVGGLIEAGGLPSNHWAPCGELLWDREHQNAEAANVLVEGLREAPWQLLWLDAVTLDNPQWQLLQEALDASGLGFQSHERFQVGHLRIRDDWETYKKSWSGNHRRNMARGLRNLEKGTQLRFRLETPSGSEQVEELMVQGFGVEDRCWKGEEGSSVLRNPGILHFYIRQAQQLAEWSQLELAFLDDGEQPFAFEYAWTAKGTYHSFKVGYDDEYARYSPGQLLMHSLLERFYHDEEHHALDCMGPLSNAVARWKPDTYRVGRLVIAPRKLLGRIFLSGYRYCWPPIRRLRQRLSEAGSTSSGAPIAPLADLPTHSPTSV